jgi:hypothetical protein
VEFTRIARLGRGLLAPGTRRGALAAAFGGTVGLLGAGKPAGGRRKKGKKPRCAAPFCRGKDCSVDTRCERPGSAVACFCRHDPKTGEPRCVQGGSPPVDACTECSGAEVCVACLNQFTCNRPCPKPR